MNKLKPHCHEKIEPEQIGFLDGMSTQINLFKLGEEIYLNKLKKRGKKDKLPLFIDLKSACDSVDRSKLYNLLLRNNILNSKEIDMLSSFIRT